MPVAQESLVTELRVMGWQAEPPYMDAAAGTLLTATLFQPDDTPVRVLTWTCTPGPLGCFEAGTEDNRKALSTFTQIATPTDGVVTDQADPLVFFLPAAAAGADLPPVFAWTLACVEGACPILDAVAADPAPGTVAWDDALAGLADPFTLLQTLPKVGTAATFRTLDIRLVADGETAPTNPTVSLASPSPITAPSGGIQAITFTVQADAPTLAFPVATAGGFEASEVEVADGEVTVTFVAGQEDSEDSPALAPGSEVELFVTFETEAGGSTVWRGMLTIAPAGDAASQN